ncbi:ankyrin repeat domain-containing protein [Vibrio mangrovi]|uniref:Ankyrin repeat domain-containing protein n=1 Tax=Vibrio mangrovi TaxID=474394 RepID=A0A1Y6IX38_9VIBR|nr:ankyrin repeat domain-containing protein [Vibrio mangrovi]MDW6005354.1 ankyrin repeat domain-containing protein [Vibrio mangrovi]SMS02206.1 Ankyrin repeats (3 copies) [Vibrio mangrovi]
MNKLAFYFSRPCLILLSLMFAGCATQPKLITAIRHHDVQKVELMLQKGSDPNVSDKNNYQRTPLYYAAEGGYNDLVTKLIAAGADVDQASSDGWTPLLAAARYDGDMETIQLLVDSGANLGQTNNYGWNALLLAIWSNKPNVVTVLLDYGLSPDHRNGEDQDAYDIARMQKNLVTPEMIQKYRDEYLQKQMIAETEQKLEVAENRDAELGLSLKRDKYLIAYSDALKNENYLEAVFYARLLEGLNIEMEDDFYYSWGETLLKLNKPEEAKVKLNEYLKRAGSQGEYYTQALRLILQTEK